MYALHGRQPLGNKKHLIIIHNDNNYMCKLKCINRLSIPVHGQIKETAGVYIVVKPWGLTIIYTHHK